MASARISGDQDRPRSFSYRGFRLTQQANLSWVVSLDGQVEARGYTMPPSSLADVKALIDWRLNRAA